MKLLPIIFILSTIFPMCVLSLTLKHKTLHINDDTDSQVLCSSHTGDGMVAITFISEEECKTYTNALVLGSTNGYSYSNCSSSTYCASYTSAIAGSTQGFHVVAISGDCISGATLEFTSSEACQLALNSTNSRNTDTIVCKNRLLSLSLYYTHYYADFTTSLQNMSLLSFNIMPVVAGDCNK